MNRWKAEFHEKVVSAAEAAQLIGPGAKVAFTSGREAFAVGNALAARKDDLKNVRILVPTPTYDFGWYDDGWQDSFDVTIRMPTHVSQKAMDASRVDFDPGTVIPFIELADSAKADIVITEVSPPDEKGFCSFGSSLWAKKRQVQEAKLVIAEVNENLIKTFGENYIHVSEIDYLVEHTSAQRKMGSTSLAGKQLKKNAPYLKTIAENVSQLIKDGDTLQVGVGRTTEPLINIGMVSGHCDLGWHSEATPPGVVSLVREGIINGKYKNIHQGKAVVTSIGGSSREEMRWVHNNPLFWLVDVAYLEDIRIISAHENFVAINNALGIDLGGQVVAETLGKRQIAAAGGQLPFVIGALHSKGGRSITVLPSTAKEGSVSRIIPSHSEGTVVTIPRNCVDYVVTEYGIAHLKGKSLRHRSEELIGIAHPDFRPELRKYAKKLFWP